MGDQQLPRAGVEEGPRQAGQPADVQSAVCRGDVAGRQRPPALEPRREPVVIERLVPSHLFGSCQMTKFSAPTLRAETDRILGVPDALASLT